MGRNKQQVATAERAAKATAAKADEAKPVAKQEAAQPTPTPAAVPNKQQLKLVELKAAWTVRGVDLSKMTVKPDGKYLLVTVAEGWPPVQIGSTGGISLPTIRSYVSAFDAAVHADELWAKQQARDARKAAAAAPKAPAPAATA